MIALKFSARKNQAIRVEAPPGILGVPLRQVSRFPTDRAQRPPTLFLAPTDGCECQQTPQRLRTKRHGRISFKQANDRDCRQAPPQRACVGELSMGPIPVRRNTHLCKLDTITGGPLYRPKPVPNRPSHRQRGCETHERQEAELGNRMVHITFSSARGGRQTNFVGLVPQFHKDAGEKVPPAIPRSLAICAKPEFSEHYITYPLRLFERGSHYCGESIYERPLAKYALRQRPYFVCECGNWGTHTIRWRWYGRRGSNNFGTGPPGGCEAC